MLNRQLVSIVISAFNAEKYIASTLDSVFQQTYRNIEVIVVNDGSTDKTLAIAESYKGLGVQIFSQDNKGQDAALNLGFTYAKGDFIKFMDSDDLLNPEMIELQVKALRDTSDHIAYSEWYRFYDDDLTSIKRDYLAYWSDMDPIDFLTTMPTGPMLQCGTMLIPRSLIDKTGLWDERLILFNDTEYFSRLILASKGVKFVQGASLYYRSGLVNSISVQKGKKYFESTLLAVDLMAQHLLKAENSLRVKTLLSNLYAERYFQLYPAFPDLCKQYQARLKKFNKYSIKFDGGRVFKLLMVLFGWKIAKSIQLFFYNMGYVPVKNTGN